MPSIRRLGRASPLVALLFIAAFLSHDAEAKRRVWRPFGIASAERQSDFPGSPLLAAAGHDTSPRYHQPELALRDLDCALLHKKRFKDKCAFIRANCADERVGFFDYLSLYYCSLAHTRFLAFTIISAWLGILFMSIGIAASDFFCINLSTIASLLGMSESMAGVTFLAFGNGSPDVFSTFAAMKVGSGSLAVGELIGAASFITAVVAGSMAIVRPFKVGRKSFVRDVSFFLVSVIFGMVFLVDGKIMLWECVVMVLLYVFYVCFVVVWHWVSRTKRRRRLKERHAREHHIDPAGDTALLIEEDNEEDEDGDVGESHSLLENDISALERANGDSEDSFEEEREEQEQEAYAELSNSMRVARPTTNGRMPSSATIRPSLVGALEFRAVLSSLRKNQNLHGRPIHLRSYSDDGLEALTRRSAPGSLAVTDGSGVTGHATPASFLRPENATHGNRARAVSVNDASSYVGHPENFPPYRTFGTPPAINLQVSSPSSQFEFPRVSSPATLSPPSQTPVWSPNSSPEGSGQTSPIKDPLPVAARHPLTLRIPTTELLAPRSPNASPSRSPTRSPSSSLAVSPLSKPGSPSGKTVPHLIITDSDAESIPGSSAHLYASPSPISLHAPSPTTSLHLPPPSIASASSLQTTSPTGWPPVKYWPYHLLPPPQHLFETLFPTLCGLRTKSWPSRVLAVLFAPSVFLLTITLPVVDGAAATEPDKKKTQPVADLLPESPLDDPAAEGANPAPADPIPPPPAAREWNRWLAAVQCITAPLFCALVLFSDPDAEPGDRTLLHAVLWALIVGLVALAVLLVTTSPRSRPRYHYLFCFVGFAVSIAWISTVAEEVVGVLKALGLILGISDAILGLTIFAVGNSLGDLVADITVARLGFPVMALSACFGGPMLNILLGIGISGAVLIIGGSGGGGGIHGGGYRIEVSSTLVISAATLIVTLAVLLVWIPINGWWMSRRVGWVLVGIWTISTALNVVVEIVGWGEKWGAV